MKKHGSKSHSHKLRDQAKSTESASKKNSWNLMEWRFLEDDMEEIYIYYIYILTIWKMSCFFKIQIVKPHTSISMIPVEFQGYSQEGSLKRRRHH